MKGRSKSFDKGIILLVLIAVIIGATATLIAFQLRSDTITEDVKENRLITILVMVHEQDKLLLTELFLYHPQTGNGALLDIPGEWGDIIDSLERMDRIDVLYDPENTDEYRHKIEDLINLEISYTIDFEISGVEDVVDLLEGLNLFIASPVEIMEEDRMVLVPSGSVVLDGRKAATYLSYEDENESDLEYRSRHQKVLQAMLKKIGERTDYLTQSEVFAKFFGAFRTSLGRRAAQSLVEELQHLDADHLILKPVHGDRVSVDDQILLFPYSKGNFVRESVRQLVDALTNTEVISERELTVVLEVLNGTTKQGLASRTRQLFMNFGYEVDRYANADKVDYEKTVVISHTSDITAAQRVASLIRCSKVEQRQYLEVDSGTGLAAATIDVTVILGNDFDGRYCKE